MELDPRLLNLLVLSGAVWRISYMLVFEDGPFNVFGSIREYAGVRYNENYETFVPAYMGAARRTIAGIFNCIYCMSVWIALLFSVLYFSNQFVSVALAVPFALSAAAILIDRLCDYG